MKRIHFVFLLLLFSNAIYAQRAKEFLIIAGPNVGLNKVDYTFKNDFQFFGPGTLSSNKKVQTRTLFLALQCDLNERIKLGIQLNKGAFYYADKDDAPIKENLIRRIGLTASYYIVNKENFRWYSGLGIQYSRMTFHNDALILQEKGTFPETRYRGAGLCVNTGILGFFKDTSFGISFDAGIDLHNMHFYEITNQDVTENITAKKIFRGLQLSAGLIFRFRRS